MASIIGIFALALGAELVAGDAGESSVVEPTERQTSDPGAARPSTVGVDMDKLRRVRREEEPVDLFAIPAPVVVASARPATVSPVTPVSNAPPVPSAPPLPFRYLGQYAGERIRVFLEKGQDTFAVPVGETIDNTYRIESVTETAVELTFLPLGIRQTLAIPPRR